VFSKEAEAIFEQRYGYRYGPKDATFNAGVYGINLQLWKEKRVTEEVEYWMRENKRSPLWQYGTQPLMLITLYQEWDYLDPRWNFNGLGWNTQINPTRLDEAFLLHWSGKMKPWLSDGLYQSYWLPYRPVECSNHGNCIESDNRFQCN
jgi:alpha-1,4-galacturonosyltransferase